MKKLILASLLAVVGSTGIASAQKPELIISDKKGWHLIGKSTVNFQKDRDEITVLGSNRFASIQFSVKDAPIYITSLEVYFESGDKQNIVVNSQIDAPGKSKAIDLNGGERNLKKIVFIYKTLPNHKDVKAHVEIWGLKTNADKK